VAFSFRPDDSNASSLTPEAPTPSLNLGQKVLMKPKLNKYVDLNTDFGQTRDWEWFEKTQFELLHHVSSVNIPCGVHDAHPRDILRAIRLAKENQCTVGAHLGYPDPQHFGYEKLDLTEADLQAWVWVQLGAFKALLDSEHLTLQHVRPHGAMYARLLEDEAFGLCLARAIHTFDPWLMLVGPMGPVLEKITNEVGLRTAPELYLGKRYRSSGELQLHRFDQDLPGRSVLDQAQQAVQQNKLLSVDGQSVPVSFKTLHLSPVLENSIELAKKLTQILGQVVPLPLVAIGPNQWLESFEVREDGVALVYGQDV
jgi:5-oxoprolinase (ATP-hydrolysing) subunit A